jgi:hypothetical protein
MAPSRLQGKHGSSARQESPNFRIFMRLFLPRNFGRRVEIIKER